MLALAMGADGVVLPHAIHRPNFNHTKSEWRAAMPQAGPHAGLPPWCPASQPSRMTTDVHSCCRPAPTAGPQWQAAHISTLLDVEAMRQELGQRGLEVHLVGGRMGGCAAGVWLGRPGGPPALPAHRMCPLSDRPGWLKRR